MAWNHQDIERDADFGQQGHTLTSAPSTVTRSSVNRCSSHPQFVRGKLSEAHSKRLRSCRSWDIYATTLGEEVLLGKQGAVRKKGEKGYILWRGGIASDKTTLASSHTFSVGQWRKASSSKISRAASDLLFLTSWRFHPLVQISLMP